MQMAPQKPRKFSTAKVMVHSVYEAECGSCTMAFFTFLRHFGVVNNLTLTLLQSRVEPW